jgi:hypothetical protein
VGLSSQVAVAAAHSEATVLARAVAALVRELQQGELAAAAVAITMAPYITVMLVAGVFPAQGRKSTTHRQLAALLGT